jgi:RNA polymerase sigma-70 factor, ECF subfamily
MERFVVAIALTEPLCIVVPKEPSGPRPDEELMLSYQRGDEEAFKHLYLRYRGRLHRFILRLTRDPTLTEEVFQETWMAVVNGRERYETSARFVTYLFGIAHRRAADHWRRRRRQPWNATSDADMDAVLDTTRETAPDAGADAETDPIMNPCAQAAVTPAAVRTPEAWAENSDLGHALLEALNDLPVLQREVFLLRAEGGLTLEEISQLCGVGRETAKSRLRYALERLRRAMRNWK